MKKALRMFLNGFVVSYFLAAALMFGCLILKDICGPLSPISTILFVIFFTFLACGDSRIARILAIGGIIVYMSSWFAISTYGTFAATLICCVGIMMWFYAAIQATVRIIRIAQTFSCVS